MCYKSLQQHNLKVRVWVCSLKMGGGGGIVGLAEEERMVFGEIKTSGHQFRFISMKQFLCNS